MINKIIAFSIKQKLIIGFLTFLLIIFGLFSAINLPIDAVPDITNNQIQIITSTPTLSAIEVERFITYPVEVSMKSLPNIIEMRSISKFGISVVTVVFEDDIDIYFARNLVFQKLKEAEENIPDGLGKPEMAPLSTGLGEIYQYVVRSEDPNDTTFNNMELRTIQDWIIKRQLLGTEGVAEVNSFGGFEKQYQILIDPDALRSYKITLRDVYEAVISNNSNVGGSYIEKQAEQYSIRGIGLVESIEDLQKIVIKSEDGVPIFLKQIADIEYGKGLRVGGVTQDGKGEVVAGIVMMLKGANSREVAQNVHEKIAKIKTSLPKGVTIDEFYNRSDLVNKTIGTVEKNLIEGGLIVIFVLVLFLGNLRAGFIVASVIPLSFLFAIIMMVIFNVSGNLMSLGAIDFGLIVEGSVIIVEVVMVTIAAKIHSSKRPLEKEELNETVYLGTTGIIKSAIFGVLIIFVVYLPIFALGGVEGKMFKPMAFTVGFALLGALILSLTYVPMMCSLILKRDLKEKETIADKIVNAIKKIYIPVLEFALTKKTIVLGTAILSLIISIYIFTKLGGEFIPKLDEGDVAYQIVRLPGISLSESINISLRLEKILKDKFPEVKTVVTKTGAPELATDPMGVEFSDVMVILKPKEEWTSASSKEELVEKMQKALMVVPGVGLSFTQPIELRFNELIAGARGDISVKIFGDDLSILSSKGNEVALIMNSIQGGEDISVQQVEGLPQLQIKVLRDKIARYGINVDDVNKVIETAIAGKNAGVIFEGDKRFDIVVKYKQDFKKDIDAIKNILVASSNNTMIPLSELAEIEIKEGPAEITRDDGNRRIVIQANVRGRDIESFVNELKTKVNSKIQMPAGYTTEYGGQFKNLESARQRLIIAIPVALFFIFALLFATFNSVKQGLLVYSGIPFSVVGGIFSLLIFGMPFSISAGIGFIALFGVSVLNGIVIIGSFNTLEDAGEKNVHDRIINGTSVKLRPVLMTPLVAALGFIPMALSTGSGAEVQRPIALVVIGGLVSSTLLTLIVLPVLYGIFNKHINPKYTFGKLPLVILFLLFPLNIFSQSKTGEDEAIRIAIENNQQVRSARLNVEKEEAIALKSFNLPNPEIFIEYEGIKGSLKNFESRKLGILQEIEFPSSYFLRSDVQSSQILIAKEELNNIINNIKTEVRINYTKLLLQEKLLEIAKDNLKIFEDFLYVAERNFDAGSSSNLEVLGARVNKIKFENETKNLESEIRITQSLLGNLMKVEYNISPTEELSFEEFDLTKIELKNRALINNPELKILKLQKEKSSNKLSLSRSELLPNISFRYYRQKIDGDNGFWGMEIGIGIPLWFWTEPAGKIKEAGYELKIAASEEENLKRSIENDLNKAFEEYENSLRQLRFFRNEAIIEADEVFRQAKISYEEGSIGYVEYLQALSIVYDTRTQYLNSIYIYNQSIINLERIIAGNIK